MEEADFTNPEILKYYLLLCNEIDLDDNKMGIKEFKYLKKGLDKKFNLDFRLVDVVNKYRDIHYKWQTWENFIKNKEFIFSPHLYSRCVMSLPFTSYSIPKILTAANTTRSKSKKSDNMFTIFLQQILIIYCY